MQGRLGAALPLMFDYSDRLQAYLRSEGAFQAASAAGLAQRSTNLLVPPRIGVPPGASSHGALPAGGDPTSEKAYWLDRVASHTLTETFVEWRRDCGAGAAAAEGRRRAGAGAGGALGASTSAGAAGAAGASGPDASWLPGPGRVARKGPHGGGGGGGGKGKGKGKGGKKKR
jgi:hypothetical protein